MTSLLKLFAEKLLTGDIPLKHVVVEVKNGLIVAETYDGQREVFSARLSDNVKVGDFELTKYHCEELQKLFKKETENHG